jgi:hypothetical protein
MRVAAAVVLHLPLLPFCTCCLASTFCYLSTLIMPAALSIVSIAGLAAAVAAQTVSLTPLTDKKFTYPDLVSSHYFLTLYRWLSAVSSHTKSRRSKSCVALSSDLISATRPPRTRSPTARRRSSTPSMVSCPHREFVTRPDSIFRLLLVGARHGQCFDCRYRGCRGRLVLEEGPWNSHYSERCIEGHPVPHDPRLHPNHWFHRSDPDQPPIC